MNDLVTVVYFLRTSVNVVTFHAQFCCWSLEIHWSGLQTAHRLWNIYLHVCYCHAHLFFLSLAGYTGMNGGPCTACGTGTFKSTTGSAGCTVCSAGTYSAATAATSSSTCAACPSNSVSPAGELLAADAIQCACMRHACVLSAISILRLHAMSGGCARLYISCVCT